MQKDDIFEYDRIVEMGIATAEEINLVRCVLCGTWKEVLEAICYARTGYYNTQQVIDAEDEE